MTQFGSCVTNIVIWDCHGRGWLLFLAVANAASVNVYLKKYSVQTCLVSLPLIKPLYLMEHTRDKSTLAEIWLFARTRKKYWLLPLILVLLSIGVILFMVEGSALSPFVYTLF